MELSNIEIIVFLLLSIVILIISKDNILIYKSHGFYRMLSWVCILLLFLNNYNYWFVNPFSLNQLIGWLFLFGSLFILIPAVRMIRRHGRQQYDNRNELFKFEKTTELIDRGIFKYIRHPMYSSLLLLTWGIFFKNVNIILLLISILSTVLLYITSKIEEKENIEYFGYKYTDYMKNSKMFIPFFF